MHIFATAESPCFFTSCNAIDVSSFFAFAQWAFGQHAVDLGVAIATVV